MTDNSLKAELDVRRRKHRDNFSNYENAVALVSTLESWFDFRWGPKGKEKAGLLDYFDRFPLVDNLTPDFEVRFHTPYVLWGDHKRTMQSESKRTEDARQILKYASRRPKAVPAPVVVVEGEAIESPPAVIPSYDVVVLVSPENDGVAAEAINAVRQEILNQPLAQGETPPNIAPIIVLGYYLDRESVGEWYKVNWREHHQNQRFSTPNISSDPSVPDLNALITKATHHAIHVDKPSLNRSGRNPFMNDTPPALYTAIRLVIPAINALLTEDERDQLQSFGRVDKTVTKDDILGTSLVVNMKPSPKKLSKWVEGALEFMVSELHCAKKVTGGNPQQYTVVVDNALLKSDVRELWSDRAAGREAKQAKGRSRGTRTSIGDSRQLKMFE